MTGPRSVVVSVSSGGRLEGDQARRVGPDSSAAVEWLDAEHAILAEGRRASALARVDRTRLWIGPARHRRDGLIVREVVVDGWQFEVEIDDLARADLRRRATRDPEHTRDGGLVQVRAALPGRVASVTVAIGDRVEPGEALVVIEAMKMLNDVRAPRAGLVQGVAATPGATVELGDLLVTLA